jgi:hypothetical protein
MQKDFSTACQAPYGYSWRTVEVKAALSRRTPKPGGIAMPPEICASFWSAERQFCFQWELFALKQTQTEAYCHDHESIVVARILDFRIPDFRPGPGFA